MTPRIAIMTLMVSGFFAATTSMGVADERPAQGSGVPTSKHAEKPHTITRQHATIHLSEYRFEPAVTTLEIGRPTQLTLINNGKVVHEFITKALLNQAVDIKTQGVLAETLGLEEVEIGPGSKVVLLFTPEKAGEFAIACHASIPEDHWQQGMSGKLVIK